MSEQVYEITLKCFNCGKTKDILVNRPPMFAFELADMANQSEMYGIVDMRNRRSLIFCNEDCANNQKTKNGTYRVRPKKLLTNSN